ncbi:uncharacterized protein PAC_07538 [Phialocephala subalpina]|uniref:Uncharacterized protein n=1 Tax=Phialocephala subalpina TaxID=576137 RepID=A0A1L7WY10_9HELO|nr:uncharacterized protein PAC_07538 [Phialocephala subalpina]
MSQPPEENRASGQVNGLEGNLLMPPKRPWFLSDEHIPTSLVIDGYHYTLSQDRPPMRALGIKVNQDNPWPFTRPLGPALVSALTPTSAPLDPAAWAPNAPAPTSAPKTNSGASSIPTSAAPPVKAIWTLLEYEVVFALVKAMLEKQKAALSEGDFDSIVRAMNDKCSGHPAGTKLVPRAPRGPASGRVGVDRTKKVDRFSKSAHTNPTRTIHGVYDYVTRGHQDEYNALCQAVVGLSGEEYGYVTKRARVEENDEGKEGAGVINEGGYGTGMEVVGGTGVMGGMAGASVGHYQQPGYGNLPGFQGQSAYGQPQGNQYQPPPPPTAFGSHLINSYQASK